MSDAEKKAIKAKLTLRYALRDANATPLQRKMAEILLRVNGIDNALGFVKGLSQIQGATT